MTYPLYNPAPLPYPQQAPRRRVWPWVVGGVVVTGGAVALGLWYAKRKAEQLANKVFTGGVGEDCPALLWTLEPRTQGFQLSVYRVEPGQASQEKRVSTAPVMTPDEARAEIPRILEHLTQASKCAYTLAGDDLAQIVEGQSFSGQYVPQAG